jgi:hypothetical protein
MDYGSILSQAWNIIWEHKWLILLGVIVALGSSSGGGGGVSGRGNVNFGLDENDFDFDMPEWDIPDFRGDFDVPGLVIVAALLFISVAVVIGIALWVAATIARGGLISGVSAIDGGGASSFAAAWNAGWRKGWRLLGIGILPAIPGFILLMAGLAAAGFFAGFYGLLGERSAWIPGAGIGVLFVLLVCILVPIALVLSLLRTFANRACMLEDLGVIASYRRGLNVLIENIGPALILFLLQIVIGVILGVALILPGLIMVLCCILWPLLLLIRGGITAYFSTMWTLAWREWTGLGHVGEVSPEHSLTA